MTDPPDTPLIRSEKIKPSIFWIIAGIVRPLFGLVARIRVQDRHKLPRTGPVILVSNHYSAIDPVFLGIAVWKMGRLPRFLAKESLFRVKGLGALMRWSGQVPVARGGAKSKDALQAAQKIIDKNEAIIIYPEGTLTKEEDLWPMKGKTGAARMALETGVLVVPVVHWGAQRIMGRYSKKIHFFPRKRVDFIVGDPIDLSAFQNEVIGQTVLTDATEKIMDELTILLRKLREKD